MENYHLTQVKTPLYPVYTQNQLHGFVMSGFVDYERILWTSYIQNNQRIFIILSKTVPDYQKAGEMITKDYTPVLDSIKNDLTLRFKLTANPTVQHSGRRKAITDRQGMFDWLNKKADLSGFKTQTVNITECESKQLHHRNCKAVTFSAATFEGVLTVTDSVKFEKALTQGIGPEKAYGMGLMQIGLV